ncbi:MAG: cysteine--tRNA ligase [Candidatus Magasanikbacteria bacterium]|nr:cysteine--tRNA ligase [Candidatus Magasanikbacteria bacterium]
MTLHLFNTLGRQKQKFKPIKKGKVGFYTCGPTVYDYAHIGNLRSFVFADILKRVLQYNNYTVKQVMNLTDVGHLVSDADEGEDKMEKGSRRTGKTAWEIAKFYALSFKKDLVDLNIILPNTLCRATDYIKEQIALIKKLEKKGFTYKIPDGIYFDTSKIRDYGKLVDLRHQDLQAGYRVNMGGKKNTNDFALWKFSPKFEKRQMEWKSPWGIGFPGWHAECSAMAVKHLGQPFDIHSGGIDLASVHHTNEIAQSEAANNKPMANYWLHSEFLNLANAKMSKSDGNFITLLTLKEKGYSPLSYRYFLLQSHYRKQTIFSFEALDAAQKGLEHLYTIARTLNKKIKTTNETKTEFLNFINNDLDTPGALAFVWEKIKEKKIDLKTLLKFDEVFGLKIKENLKETKIKISDDVEKIIKERNNARTNKDWAKSDELRKKLENLGYKVEDGKNGTNISE